MTIQESLISAIRQSAVFNSNVQVSPFCILWPDKDRQWESAIPVIQASMPELLVLGPYNPAKRCGPAIWLRCVVAGFEKKLPLEEGTLPVIYMPGVSRQELRAVESCPSHLVAIAELQYRGVFWSQVNSKDWTAMAFLVSSQGGLGMDVSQDADTKNALLLALPRLLEEDIDQLKGKRLDNDFLNGIASGKDVPKDLLLWMNNPEGFRSSRDANSWKAFNEICASQFSFKPEQQGELEAAKNLANHEGPWIAVWDRYREAPNRYAQIPELIRKVQVPTFDLFADEQTAGGWPQWNESEEQALQEELLRLSDMAPHVARKKILELEQQYGKRRSLVWAELGMAPLAIALEHLSRLAMVTSDSFSSLSLKSMEESYRTHGWKADAAVLDALATSSSEAIHQAVTAAIRAVYTPWAEDAARRLQVLVQDSSYPGSAKSQTMPVYGDGTCLVFVDGLRFDTARMLQAQLVASGKEVAETLFWAALPSITITGKPAVTPVANLIDGSGSPPAFEPGVAGTGQSLKGGYHLRKLLTDNGWQILENQETGNVKGRAWCEIGNLDHEGHDRGWKLALHLQDLLVEVKERVLALCEAGWKTIRIVTDHGWLLLPGGLPKTELPSYLTETQNGRCATMKTGATTKHPLYSWYWDSCWEVALADGISCFRAGDEYQHGGLSLQECLTLQLTITGGNKLNDAFTGSLDLTWKGMRCNVVAEGDTFGLMVDIRLHAGVSSTSVVVDPKPFRENGVTSVVVEDGDLEGKKAVLLLLDLNGNTVFQMETKIGGGR